MAKQVNRTGRSQRAGIAVVFTAIAIVLAACSGGSSGDSTKTGPIVVARNAALGSWDADKCSGPGFGTLPMVYDNLIRIKSPDGQGFAPGLATSWDYDEASKSYSLVLRDAKFSNGDALTADDVVFSFDQWQKGEGSSFYYAAVDHAEVVDAKTVKVVMKQQDSFLPALLTWCTSSVYPKDFAGMSAKEYFAKPIGAGPLAVVKGSDMGGSAEELTLKPNADYWNNAKAKPYADGLILRTMTDSNLRTLAFKSGDVDILEKVDPAGIAQIDAKDIVKADPQGNNGIMLNTRKSPLNDPNVRKAISLALDRKAIAKALNGTAVAAVSASTTNVPGGVDPTSPYTFDVAEAKKLIDGSPAAGGVTLEYLYDPSEAVQQTMAQIMQEQLGEIGIKLKLVASDFATVRSAKSAGKFDIAQGGTLAISPDIFDPLSVHSGLNYPATGLDPTTLNDLFISGTSTHDEGKRKADVQKFVDQMQDDAAVIGVVNFATIYAVGTEIDGFEPTPYEIWYADTVTRK